MLKVEASTLEIAYANAAEEFNCSVTELIIEIVQVPSNGFLGFFKKSAIIVAVRANDAKSVNATENEIAKKKEIITEPTAKVTKPKKEEKQEVKQKKVQEQNILNDTIMPASFVSDQDEEDDDLMNGLDYTADYDDEFDEVDDAQEEEVVINANISSIAQEVKEKINTLFKLTCFGIDTIEVTPYDNETLLVEFKGDDAALLIGKEGYRYKALSYMIFNWINAKYDVQLRLEIAEFLKNQEESVGRYLINVYENIDRDGRAQTKILDGVLVQIALKELRAKYPQKYVVIRSTRDGLKYIIINDYNN